MTLLLHSSIPALPPLCSCMVYSTRGSAAFKTATQGSVLGSAAARDASAICMGMQVSWSHIIDVTILINQYLLKCYKNAMKEGWCRVQLFVQNRPLGGVHSADGCRGMGGHERGQATDYEGCCSGHVAASEHANLHRVSKKPEYKGVPQSCNVREVN